MGKAAIIAASFVVSMSCPVEAAHAVCEGATGTPTVIRSTRDTRIMQTHRSSNDGAAGLIWLKRSPHVRGILGFDLSGVDVDDVGCAALELSVYDGQPTKNGSWFSVHRLDAEWVEGNQSFNRLRVSGKQLGSFGGTGTGTTWDCRVDADLGSSGTSDCPPSERWLGGEDCAGAPCYAPASTADVLWADKNDPLLAFDVTADVVASDGDVSWLIKVRDETAKSGSVKFYTRDGAAFVGLVDPDVTALEALELAPRLLLYGGRPPEPPEDLGNSHLCYGASTTKGTPSFPQVSALEIGDTQGSRLFDVKRASSLCPPAEVEGAPSGPAPTGRIAYDVRRASGQSRLPTQEDVTVNDALGQLVVDILGADTLLTTATIERGGPATPAGPAVDHLCHRIRVESSTAAFSDGVRVHVTDGFEDRIYDIKKALRLCLAATVGGAPPAEPDSHTMCYKAVRASGEPKHQKVIGEIHTADRFGTLRLNTKPEEELCLPATLGPAN